MNRFIILSGCSGGGKSTILAELQHRGYSVHEEPGRRIIAQERRIGGRALPWIDLRAFAERAIAMSLQDRDWAATMPGIHFFDRGLIDAAAALEHATGRRILSSYASTRYNRLVFMTPPWPEIYATDADRTHGFAEAVAEYRRLTTAYRSLGYVIRKLPRASVSDRTDFLLKCLESS